MTIVVYAQPGNRFGRGSGRSRDGRVGVSVDDVEGNRGICEFFIQLTESQRREFKAIFLNPNATRAQIRQSLRDWAAKQGDSVK